MTRTNRTLYALAALIAVLAFAGCSSGGPTAPNPCAGDETFVRAEYAQLTTPTVRQLSPTETQYTFTSMGLSDVYTFDWSSGSCVETFNGEVQ